MLTFQPSRFPKCCSSPLSGVCVSGMEPGYLEWHRVSISMEMYLPHLPTLSTRDSWRLSSSAHINHTFLEFPWHYYFHLSVGLSEDALQYYLTISIEIFQVLLQQSPSTHCRCIISHNNEHSNLNLRIIIIWTPAIWNKCLINLVGGLSNREDANPGWPLPRR